MQQTVYVLTAEDRKRIATLDATRPQFFSLATLRVLRAGCDSEPTLLPRVKQSWWRGSHALRTLTREDGSIVSSFAPLVTAVVGCGGRFEGNVFMGHLIYGVAPAINIDDRTLHHLRAVIVTKLRRDESFSFTWDDEPAVHGDDAVPGRGAHGTVWISKSSSLYFNFDGPLEGPLNPTWLRVLADSAAGNAGLRPLPEP